jgi:hypothetical protein
MQESANITKPLRMAPSVFWAALAGAFIIGWASGLAPDYLGGFGRFILYWVLLPVSIACLFYGIAIVIKAQSLSGIPTANENKSFVLTPDELNRWRSIKPGMDRHEVVAIIGQPEGPPRVVDFFFRDFVDLPSDYNGKMVYAWGNGRIYFEPNGGPVFQVKIPEYI